MKTLVVDDDAIVLDSCRRVLEAANFEVCLVASADEALDKMRDAEFDLLLVDVKMPGHDGMYLMREARQRWADVPIIVMSGYPTPQTIAEGIQAGAAKFIAKPFTPDELLEAIHQVLNEEDRHETNEGVGN